MTAVKRILGSLYLQNRFFAILVFLVVGFLVAYMVPSLFGALNTLSLVLVPVVLGDLLLLYATRGRVEGRRMLPEKLSNGDDNPIELRLVNRHRFRVGARLIDELPFQFQKRDFGLRTTLAPGREEIFRYALRPTQRGVYRFGSLNVFVTSPLGLLARRYSFDQSREVPVYPSFLQLRKFELLAFSNRLQQYGLKKIRRIGHTLEFEQIKDYVQGDDIRNINWKATAKRGAMMVNQYQDEKSQPVYSVIDRGRVMKMPFNGLALLDYAINTSLVISNIALKKHDRAGIFSFGATLGNLVIAQRRSSQMSLIMEALYRLETNFVESDFGTLYVETKRILNQRSLLLLYTNFETLDALHRQLPYLMALARQHLLVVIFFENTELGEFADQRPKTVQGLYDQVIAEKFIYEKKRIVVELGKYGIQTILTRPEALTANTINKYLELKARGLF